MIVLLVSPARLSHHRSPQDGPMALSATRAAPFRCLAAGMRAKFNRTSMVAQNRGKFKEN